MAFDDSETMNDTASEALESAEELFGSDEMAGNRRLGVITFADNGRDFTRQKCLDDESELIVSGFMANDGELTLCGLRAGILQGLADRQCGVFVHDLCFFFFLVTNV